MSKFKTNLLVILFLGLFIADAQAYLCKDCRRESKNLCIIKNGTGYTILYEMGEHKLRHIDEISPITDNQTVCIPPGLDIKETSFGIACVWSPASGCQMLLHESNEYESYSCSVCRYDAYDDGKQRCPCTKKNLPSGSGLIYNASVPILMAFYFVRQLTLLLKQIN